MNRMLIAVVAMLLAVALTACSGREVEKGEGLRYLHDADHRVSCWGVDATGLSCLPDSQVANPGYPPEAP